MSVGLVLIINFLIFGFKFIDVESACYGKDFDTSSENVCSICRCSNNLTTVNCRWKKLISIPPILPQQLKWIYLSHNNISEISEYSFKNCSSLEQIKIDHNNLTFLHDERAFIDLSIEKIDLSYNWITLSKHSTVFQPIAKSLTHLLIYRNRKISQNVFSGLKNLRVLKLDGNVSGGFGDAFSTLKKLNRLKIWKPLGKITEKTFEKFENLKHLNLLDLTDADITDIEPGAFTFFKNLTNLDLSRNKNFSLSKTFKPLKSVSNTLISLQLLQLIDDSQISMTLTEEFYASMEDKKNLKVLQINKNEISYAENGFCQVFQNLNTLDISYNRFQKIQNLFANFFKLKNLKNLFASYQSKRFYDRGSDDIRFTKKVDDSYDYVDRDSSNDCHAVRPIKCDIKSFIGDEDIGEDVWCIVIPKNLQFAEVKNIINENFDWLPAIVVLGKLSITKIVLQDNALRNIRGPVIINSPRNAKPMEIDLSCNFISCFAPDLFEFSIKKRGLVIGELNLEKNELAKQLSSDEDGKTFALYSNLTVLNLSNNKIKKLNPKTFCNLNQLRVLNLSENSLQTLNFNISHMKLLEILDLSYNLLVSLDGTNRMELSILKSESLHNNLSLWLLGNPLQCICETMPFLEWIQSNELHIFNRNETECQTDKNFTKMKDLDQTIRELNFNCFSALPLKISGCLLGLLIICVFLAVVLHKYRWDIRYYFMKVYQSRKHYKLLDESLDRYYDYDAFVSYDAHDRLWVVKELILNLETPDLALRRCPVPNVVPDSLPNSAPNGVQNGVTVPVGPTDGAKPVYSGGNNFENADDRFALCIHERDFEAGIEIETNILSAIESSRKVLLVVTNHFIKSRWCRFELEMARLESLERGRNLVVTVFLEPVVEKLDSLTWLTRRYTYLEWYSYTEDEKHEFWKRLKVALGDVKREKIICECGREFFN